MSGQSSAVITDNSGSAKRSGDAAQLLRVRRTFLAAMASGAAGLILVCMHFTGMIDRNAMLIAMAMIAGSSVLFLGLIASGANRKFEDPSLTAYQVLVASAVMLFVAFHATAHGHTITLMSLPMAMAFASFRYGSKELIRLSALLLLMTLIEVMLRWAAIGGSFRDPEWQSILTGVAAMAVSLVALTVIGGQVNDLRRQTWAERASSHLAMSKLNEAVFTVNPQNIVRFANAGAQTMFGVREDNAAGRSIDEVCRFIDRDPISRFLAKFESESLGKDPSVVSAETVEGVIQKPDGTERHIEVSVSPLSARKVIEGYVLVARDTTERRELINELKHAATHDVLTGLLNRRGFAETVGQSLRALSRTRGPWVIVVDLDKFKVVNDSCGHQAGDELLKQVANMMRAAMPKGGKLARLGGDEFGAVIQSKDAESALRVGDALVREFADMRFNWEGRSFKVGASIGVAEYTPDCLNVEGLLGRADSACFVAKERGSNRVQQYNLREEEVVRHQNDLGWVATINEALENDRFVLFGQRIARSDPNNPGRDKFELLVRLISKEGQVVVPGIFLPAAERFGLIAALDRKVISVAFQQLGAAAQTGVQLPQISINLSPNSLRDPSLLSFIEDGLKAANLPGDLFTFELTETAAIFDLDQACTFFGALREMGCEVALDDVGSGFNSFYNMRQLPLDQIKIDGSYIQSVCDNDLDRVFVESIDRIAKTLGVKTVAEFVENNDIRRAVHEIGVDYVQGFGVHKPEPLKDVLLQCSKPLPGDASVLQKRVCAQARY